MQRFVLLLLAAAVPLLILLPDVAFSAPRGQPSSPERTKYCRKERLNCLNVGNSDCARDFPKDAAAQNVCFAGVRGACEIAYGKDSVCQSSSRVRLPKVTLPTGQTYVSK